MRKIWNATGDFFWECPNFEALGITIGIFAVAVILAFATVLPLHRADVEEYNDGVCPCGGQYEYSQAVGHRIGTTYIYVCNECGTPIEIDFIP